MRHHYFAVAVCGLVIAGLVASSLNAAPTAEQKKELKAIAVDITKVGILISKKKFDEAANAIQEIEDRINTFVEDSGIKEADPILKQVHIPLEKLREKLAKASGKGIVGFEKTVAPILVSKCVSCHGADAKGGLRLDTFEGMEKGGANGNLVVPGDVESSLLFQRLVTPDDQLRMPKGKEALSEKEVKAIGAWIVEGARFEGDKTAKLTSLAKAAASGKPAPVKKIEIAKETGKETVHFTTDLMPELVDTCGRCHNDNPNTRAGFSVMSFEKLMKGGDSGSVITAGSLEKSRLWRLLNGPDDGTPVMPAGNQTGITRPWYDKMRTWILEGAKFDGSDPKKKFPSLEEREAAALARYTPEQWLDRRKKSAEADWAKTFPKGEPKANQREAAEFLFYGDVADERLEQIEKWANEHVASLRHMFKIKEEQLWKGKLAVFVFKDRFGYEEFNNSVHRREVPREIMGHSQVVAGMEDAFIALQDIGDAATESSPGMQVNLVEHVTGAYLKRNGSKLPDWLVRGTGLALAHQKSSGNPYLTTLPRLAAGYLQESKLDDPGQIFVDGTFSPSEIGPVGFTIVEFLLKKGNPILFGQFVQKIQTGSPVDAAIKAVYQSDSKTLAIAYGTSLPNSSKKTKK